MCSVPIIGKSDLQTSILHILYFSINKVILHVSGNKGHADVRCKLHSYIKPEYK